MISIHKATLNDIDVIRDLAERTWWPAYEAILSADQIRFMLDSIYSTERLTQHFTTGDQEFYLIKDANTPQGFAAVGPRAEDAVTYKLFKLYVLPQTQGKGYGKMLLKYIIEEVRSRNINFLDLNVNRYNKARYFYERVGFHIIREEDVPIGPYWMNDFVMRLDLAAPSHL